MKGIEVKEILKKNRFSTIKVAELLGMSQQNLQNQLSRDDVRTGLVERIAQVTGLPMSVFYGGANIATANGEHASAVAGNNNTTAGTDARWLDELSAQRKLTEKAMQQNSDLLAIVKVLSGAVTQK